MAISSVQPVAYDTTNCSSPQSPRRLCGAWVPCGTRRLDDHHDCEHRDPHQGEQRADWREPSDHDRIMRGTVGRAADIAAEQPAGANAAFVRLARLVDQ